MNEPQVWTLIGVFAAMAFGMLTLMSTMFLGAMNRGFDGIRAEMDARFDGLRGEMSSRFDRMDDRFDHLDRDVQALARHVFPDRD